MWRPPPQWWCSVCGSPQEFECLWLYNFCILNLLTMIFFYFFHVGKSGLTYHLWLYHFCISRLDLSLGTCFPLLILFIRVTWKPLAFHALIDTWTCLWFSLSSFIGNGLVPETAAKRHDVCGNQNHGKPSLDLLKDEIVSEQLTRYQFWCTCKVEWRLRMNHLILGWLNVLYKFSACVSFVYSTI